MTWTYKGIEISFEEGSGSFSARLPDGDSKYSSYANAESLKEMKKKIDASFKLAIKKGVKLFARSGWGDDIRIDEVEITSVAGGERGYKEFWVKNTTTGARTKESSRELLKHDKSKVDEYVRLKKEAYKINEEADNLLENLKLETEEVFSLVGLTQKKEK